MLKSKKLLKNLKNKFVEEYQCQLKNLQQFYLCLYNLSHPLPLTELYQNKDGWREFLPVT